MSTLLLLLAGCPSPADSGKDSTAAPACSTPTAWYTDADGDRYGAEGTRVEACDQPSGTVDRAGDCDDGDAGAFPGAPEVWYDGTDQDCAGGSDYDQDADGHDGLTSQGDDCKRTT
jgi:Putative metal-binding motif